MLSDGDDGFRSEMLQAFTEYYPQMVETIRSALANNDAESFRHAVHKAKSPSRMIGLNELCDKLDVLELETSETRQIPEGALSIIEEFVAKGQLAIEEIKQILA